jgi:hypothetical protein
VLFGGLRPPLTPAPDVPRPHPGTGSPEIDSGMPAEYGLPGHAPGAALPVITSITAVLCDAPPRWAWRSRSRRRPCRGAGMAQVLGKPATPAQLRAVLAEDPAPTGSRALR